MSAAESELISRAREGNHAAFRQLAKEHMKKAYNVAFSYVGSHEEAEDVTQEALVRAFRGLQTFREEAGFGTWLHRIVVNLAMNRMKQNSRRARIEVPANHPDVEGIAAQQGLQPDDDLRENIERALHELPTLQRAVVILRHLNGLSTRQVSAILQCSEGTVKTHLFRGLKKMRQKLAFLEGELS
jgi:RNA polymerase sigma-70 factor (ECF subfamily)